MFAYLKGREPDLNATICWIYEKQEFQIYPASSCLYWIMLLIGIKKKLGENLIESWIIASTDLPPWEGCSGAQHQLELDME